MRTFLFLITTSLLSTSFATPVGEKLNLRCDCYSATVKYRLDDFISVTGKGQELWHARLNARYNCSRQLTEMVRETGLNVAYVRGRVLNCGDTPKPSDLPRYF